MKNLLILLGWFILTFWLIIERSAKIIGVIFIVCWDFKPQKEDFKFWSRYYSIIFDKDYYSLKEFYYDRFCSNYKQSYDEY